ncbi:MAG: polyamine aminopropyltransferase [Dethiobacteria bacterium]|jgi:spermidine synthase
MELWYTEKQTPNIGFSCKVKETLYRIKTQFQELAVLDTLQFGRMLVLDGMVQTTLADEFIYHEMITHVPMRTHPNPAKVLIIGGGDGGAVREAAKYPDVSSITLVEIDEQVIEVSRRFFPEISCSLEDPRVKIRITDGIEYVQSIRDPVDIIIVDSTEPVGPAIGLFSLPFYESVGRALKDDGIMVVQTESPFFNTDLIRKAYSHIKAVFPQCFLYLAPVPTYPSGYWSFMLGTRQYNPLKPVGTYLPPEMKYYTPEVHQSAFCLPRFVQELIK